MNQKSQIVVVDTVQQFHNRSILLWIQKNSQITNIEKFTEFTPPKKHVCAHNNRNLSKDQLT